MTRGEFIPEFDVDAIDLVDNPDSNRTPVNAPAIATPVGQRIVTSDTDWYLMICPQWSGDNPRLLGFVDDYREYTYTGAVLRPGETVRLRWRSVKWGPDGSADIVAERDFSYDDALALMSTPHNPKCDDYAEQYGARDRKCWRVPRAASSILDA